MYSPHHALLVERGAHQVLAQAQDAVHVREGHLDVQLRELRLPVRAEILGVIGTS